MPRARTCSGLSGLAASAVTALTAALLATATAGPAALAQTNGAASANSQDGQQGGHRQLGAHVHGQGSLNIAIEGDSVSMELEAPAADIVGFEHAPASDVEKSALETAKQKLAAGLILFRLPDAAKCQLTDADVTHETGASHDHDEKDGEHKHSGDHKHGDEHAKDHDHDHEHAKGEHDHDDHASGHSEFHVAYTLTCAAPASLTEIAFDYFKEFKNAERLAVGVVTDKGQATFEASRSKPVVSLGGLM